MDMAPAARETVLEAYGQGPSNYVLNYVEERVGDRWGSGEARRFNNGPIRAVLGAVRGTGLETRSCTKRNASADEAG